MMTKHSLLRFSCSENRGRVVEKGKNGGESTEYRKEKKVGIRNRVGKQGKRLSETLKFARGKN